MEERYGILYESLFGSETRDVTVTLAEGNFKYEILETVSAETPFEGPAVPRSKFAQGETVYVHYKIRNDGAVKARATIKVTDIDTGAVVTTIGPTSEVDPGWKLEIFRATVGTMPNRNWRLRFAVTP